MSTGMLARSGAVAAYRREIREAQTLGVSDKSIALVISKFRGEHPDIDDLRAALQQYVPARAIYSATDNPYRP